MTDSPEVPTVPDVGAPRGVKHARVGKKRRMKRALELRIQGYSYEQIGAIEGYSERSAQRYVNEALDRQIREPARQLIQLEVERLDALLTSAQKILDEAVEETTKLQALDRVLKVAERRARLLGLDSPVKVDATQRHIHYSIEGVDVQQLIGVDGETQPEAIVEGTVSSITSITSVDTSVNGESNAGDDQTKAITAG